MNDMTARGYWDTTALDHFIHKLGAHKDRLKAVTQSLRRANEIFLYHHACAEAALGGLLDDVPNDAFHHMSFVLRDSGRQDEFDAAMIKSEAHLNGCIHTVRNNFDLFAQLVNGLVLNDKFAVREVDYKRVTDAISVSPLQAEMKALLDSDWFQYARGFANTAKHRQLVKHSYHVTLMGSQPHGIRLDFFEYDGRQFFQYGIEEVLAGLLALERKLGTCGSRLNDQLGIA